MAKKLSKEQWEQRIRGAGAGRYEFVRWAVDDKFGSNHKCVVRCAKDWHEWIATPNSLIDAGRGCPQCSGKRRWTEMERVEQINKLKNIRFVSWLDGYKNSFSKANVICAIDHHTWCASVNNIVNKGSGCPKCAKYGYQLDKKGYLYALRSECGMYLKVGISNKPSRRHYELARDTPFTFNLVEQFSGDGVKIYELEKHFH